MTRSRYRIVENKYAHFMTCTMIEWLPVFRNPSCVQIIFDAWNHLRANKGLQILGYVVMPHHLHLIARAPDLSKVMQSFKSFTAKRIIEELQQLGKEHTLLALQDFKRIHKIESQYQVWQEGNHPEELTNDAMIRQKLDYIHMNPVRAGLVLKPEEWLYSSVRNYLHMECPFEIDKNWRGLE